MNPSPPYFDPETLARIRPLGLRARTLVEGMVAGLHRSPLRGHSIEFAQHREYVPGDDLRQVDWKVYARSDKHYLKQYEDETSLTCYLMVDHSQSMRYRGNRDGLSKLEYGQLVACSLAYLVVEQRDQVGLATFSETIDDWLPPSASPSQFDDMLQIMEGVGQPRQTDLPRVIEQLAGRLKHRGLVVLISDMLDEVPALLQSLRLLRSAGHDAMLVHVLDRDEIDFPFDQMARFEGLEGRVSVSTDPMMIGNAYRRAMANFCHSLEAGCRQIDLDYYRVVTDEPFSMTIPRMLATRSARGWRA